MCVCVGGGGGEEKEPKFPTFKLLHEQFFNNYFFLRGGGKLEKIPIVELRSVKSPIWIRTEDMLGSERQCDAVRTQRGRITAPPQVMYSSLPSSEKSISI